MKTITTLLCVAALAVAADAGAQQPTHLTLPTDGRWDVAGQLALLNRNKSDLSAVGSMVFGCRCRRIGGTLLDAAFQDRIRGRHGGPGHHRWPGEHARFPDRVSRINATGNTSFARSTFGATALYQFFDNQWVHPFVGAGVELAREQHFADSLPAETAQVLNHRSQPAASARFQRSTP